MQTVDSRVLGVGLACGAGAGAAWLLGRLTDVQTALLHGGDPRAAGGGPRVSLVATLLDRSWRALAVVAVVLVAAALVGRVRTGRPLLRPTWREPRGRSRRAAAACLWAGTVLVGTWLVVRAHTSGLTEPGGEGAYEPRTALADALLAGGLTAVAAGALCGAVAALRAGRTPARPAAARPRAAGARTDS